MHLVNRGGGRPRPSPLNPPLLSINEPTNAWRGSLVAVCRTSELEVAGLTPGLPADTLQQPWASCSHTSASVTKQYSLVSDKRAIMLCGWEGNRRSGVALALRHRLSGLSTYGLNDQRLKHKHPV